MNIICEPFVGEFGWEIFCWQGYLRKLAEAGNQIFVNCLNTSGLLYYDFAKEIRIWPRLGIIRDMWKNKDWKYEKTPNEYLRGFNSVSLYKEKYQIIRNDSYQTRNWSIPNSGFFDKQKLFCYLDSPLVKDCQSVQIDVLIHARRLFKHNTGYRNWNLDDLKRYIDLLPSNYKIGFIGLHKESARIDGINNFQNMALPELAALMRNAKVIVGPISGVIHFATLCKLPQLAWVTKAEHAERIKSTWNPFGIKTKTLYSGTDKHWIEKTYWIPPVIDLVRFTRELVEN